MTTLAADLDSAIGQAVTGLPGFGYSWAEIGLDLPLNLQGNPHNRFHSARRVRARCVAQARTLPVLPDPGIGGGHRARTPPR